MGSSLFVLRSSLLIPYPNGVLAHPLYVDELDRGGRIVHILYPVEDGCHALAPVNSGTYHEADLVEESRGKEGGVDMATAYNGKPLYRKLRTEYLHGAAEVYAVAPACYPRYALRR